MREVNWGIIGLGKIASKFAEGFKFVNNAKLKGIASKNPKKIESFESSFNIDNKYSFNNYDDIIKCDQIDIIYIALPNSFHKELIIKCIKNNKKILVEKPATLNFTEIDEIKKNYNLEDIFFAEAFMYRYHPQILKVIEMIKEKVIGDITLMKTNFGKDILTKKSFFGFNRLKKLDKKNRLFSKELGGGAILDLGCYPVSFSILIASLISGIEINKFKILNKKKNIGTTGVDLDSYAELKFENSFSSHMGASFTKNLGKKSEIIGTKGTLIIKDTWHGNPSQIILKNQKNQEIVIEDKKNIYSYQISCLSRDILDGKKKPDFPGMTFDDSLINMRIIQEWLK